MPIKLPKTIAEFASPAGKAAIDSAEQRLNAFENLQVIVIKNGVRQPAVSIKFAGGTAILELTV